MASSDWQNLDRWLCTAWLCLLLVGVGCSSRSPATVSGTITIDGEQLPGGERITGNVMFYPQGGGAAVYGQVVDGGRFSLKTGGKQGLQPGNYDVTVRIVEIDPPPPGGHQNAPGSTPLTPPHYAQRDSSGLQATVAAAANTIDFDLTRTP